jgi:hypothetical protein
MHNKENKINREKNSPVLIEQSEIEHPFLFSLNPFCISIVPNFKMQDLCPNGSFIFAKRDTPSILIWLV